MQDNNVIHFDFTIKDYTVVLSLCQKNEKKEVF